MLACIHWPPYHQFQRRSSQAFACAKALSLCIQPTNYWRSQGTFTASLGHTSFQVQFAFTQAPRCKAHSSSCLVQGPDLVKQLQGSPCV